MSDYYDDSCYCIMCGAHIPEGRIICPNCEEYCIKVEEENKNNSRCIMCGVPIPEGRIICTSCEEYCIKVEEKNKNK